MSLDAHDYFHVALIVRTAFYSKPAQKRELYELRLSFILINFNLFLIVFPGHFIQSQEAPRRDIYCGSRRWRRTRKYQAGMDRGGAHPLSSQHLGGDAVPPPLMGGRGSRHRSFASHHRNLVHSVHNHHALSVGHHDKWGGEGR